MADAEAAAAEAKRRRAHERKARYEALMRPWPIKLAASKSKGRHIVAKEDLAEGSLVISETASGFSIMKPLMDEVCLYCLGPLKALEPATDDDSAFLGPQRGQRGIVCKGCRKQSYWCSEACQKLDESRHSRECDILKELPGITSSHSVDYGLFRLILAILTNRSPEDDGSEGFVPEESSGAGCSGPTPFSYVRDLVSHRSSCKQSWLNAVQNAAEDLSSQLPSDLAASASELVTMACQINSNSHGLLDPVGNTNSVIGVGLFPLASMFNHSCSPNCSFVGGSHGRLVIRTLRPIARGEELCVSYVDLFYPKDKRREKLLETKFFFCDCSRCSPEAQEGIVDPDLYLEGVYCRDCREGIYISDSSDDELMKCSNCGSSLERSAFNDFQAAVERDFDAAFDFVKARHTSSALQALQRFRKKYAGQICPQHHHYFNSLVPLMNCSMKERNFKDASGYIQEIIRTMEGSHVMPANWPELSDFYYHLGDVEEIRAKAIEAGLETGLETGLEGSKSADDCYGVSLDAFRKCWDMRKVAFGAEHAKTLDAEEQVHRLKSARH
ncbi:uncharacterized protein BJ171DRAFT_453684 [Polychytrium aggregatum]|uniref:uncharacterized protein n=1 Tax=Polychytrium aggregatum TaxID=110093 RepID=UPI0022FDEDE2|nr:uncharacterized protein BJ171DRAFT_453684 [Polychytrium aggregatum]KAI9209539.1 hypothetical protein BJ171DRAFT_453684 [Polychytrium aggregatum]